VTAIFEGAQGVLLDEWKGFPPYTTWSTVTTDHALELVTEHNIEDVTVLGLTRAYATRHGEGPFPTFDAEFSSEIEDLGNPNNAWQGAIRSGPLDLVLLRYAVESCPVDGLVVSNFDQVPDAIRYCARYTNPIAFTGSRSLKEQEKLTLRLKAANPVIEKASQSELLNRLAELAPVVITADGPTHMSRRFVENQTVLLPPK
jgi:adenylosuccinate synthase